MAADRILVTGGTGKTGGRLASRLAASGLRPRVASRRGGGAPGCDAVRFDWNDPASYAATLRDVAAVYLVAPSGAADPLAAMRPFLRASLDAGVRRFVLLSASSLPEGGPLMGQVHAWLRAEATDWAVLRPSWFMQNFSEGQHLSTIRDEGAILTAAGDGRVGFVHADDIAAVAAAALSGELPCGAAPVLTGPRALSYAEVAALIAAAAGRPVRHVDLSEAALAARHATLGLEPGYASGLAAMDTAVADGSEDRVTDAVARVTGRPPIDMARFAVEEAAVWRRP